jgi:YebC/PmpR family DNA-binding regulatory protein
MSGHSKWANIKRKKEANDKVKGKLFAKLSRYITLAIVEGGGLTDPENNVRLRLTIEKAKESNMPKESIQRAIDKGSSSESAQMKEVRYEAFGPFGVAFLITAITDNPNRTVAAVKNTIERNGGKMGSLGSVGYLFNQCGMIVFDKNTITEDLIFEFADKIKAQDIETEEEEIIVYIPFEHMGKVKEYLGEIKPLSLEVISKPSVYMELSREEEKDSLNLIELIEDVDDVQAVFTNAQFDSLS